MNVIAEFRRLTRTLDRSLELVASSPETKRETEYYLSRIGKIKTVDQLLGDQRVFSYAMKAFGLDDMIYAKAFMRKVLKEGIDEQRSFANQLADQRFYNFAEAFNFARYGEAATAFDRTQVGTTEKYIRAGLEERAGNQNEGLRLALYFLRKAPEVRSIYGLLADKPLYQVVRTALGLPPQFSAIGIEKQAALIGARLKIEDLSKPEKLNAFLDRFLGQWQLANSGSGPQSSPFVTSQSSQGFGSNLLKMQTALNRWRLG